MNVFLCLKFKSRFCRVTQNRVLSSHSNLLLPPNPKWSKLEAFSVASLVSTLFAVPVCSKLVHWDPKVVFHFTQNFIHNWTNWVQLPKTIKSGLKFEKIKQWLKNVSTFSFTYIWEFNKNLYYNATVQHTQTWEIIQSVSLYDSL